MCERLGSKRYTKISLSPEIEKGKKKVQKSFGYLYVNCGLPWWLRGIESGCQCRRHRFDPQVTKIPWRRKWKLTPVFLPGKSHGQRSLAGCSPWGGRKLDTIYGLNNTNNVNCSH